MAKKYKVKVLVKGNVANSEKDFMDVFEQRQYLENPHLTSTENGMEAEIEVEAREADLAEKFVQEQVWEVGNAVLEDIDGFSVEKVSVEELTS